MVQRFHAVSLKRIACVHDVDDLIGKIHNRREFHSTVQLDDVGLYTS